ncbi:MAG: bifunctional diaminohydroxyphosphoribosylaminopyrimidine deaminase/5-amino-6-(5-phosphoribosylamino)uracil reductase RibD [Acidiferrobacteraceae bacterium]
MTAGDRRHMARALALAKRGLATTDPNPRVGCVIVRDGERVGEGWHERAGQPHAEVNALAQAGERAVGATVYVTLEPCAHTGRTPPCADALIAARVARVVMAVIDPNPLVSGGGVERLRSAGIAVDVGLLEDEARRLNPGFFHRMTRGRPYVRVKLAASLDGRTAMASGESRWITGEAARADVQRFRARASVILTGIGTVLRDDPALTVRPDTGRAPLRVVADSHFRTPPGARLLREPGSVVIAGLTGTASDACEALSAAGAEIERFDADEGGRVPMGELLARLAHRGANEVWTEAGPTLAGRLVAARLADEFVLYFAPRFLGHAAQGLIELPGLARLADSPRLRIADVRAVGDDWRVIAYPEGPELTEF